MSLEVPKAEEVNLEFKLQSKIQLFSPSQQPKDNCHLIAAASAYGLVFVASSTPELKVFQLSSITGAEKTEQPIPLRTVPLPSEPLHLAVNCDSNLLAVDVLMNGTAFLTICSVPSFLSQTPKVLETIRLSPEPNVVRSKQLAWNPAIAESLAVCLDNGAMSVYVFKQPGFEFHSLDKSKAVQAVCWSPKGKQIVVGHPNFNLVQYKPDLKPARIIQCPLNPDLGQNCTILAVQWLSTYQFAVSVKPQGEEVVPNLHIVNAPKSNQITAINYDDLCFSSYGPRQHQVYLIHIQPWNMLIIASANSVESAILATTETGDAPVWKQYLVDFRPELPLTNDKQESFPVGLALETGCTHQLTVAEQLLPVMPMVHFITNHGQLVSFNILNFLPNTPGICSPPRPLPDMSGLSQFVVQQQAVAPPKPVQIEPPKPQIPQESAKSDMTFNIAFGATSTPDVSQKSKPLFGGLGGVEKPQFGAQPESKPLFGGFGSATQTQAIPFGAPKPLPNLAPITQQPEVKQPILPQPQQNADQKKPLITVPPKYTTTTTPIQKSDSSSNVPQASRKVDDDVINVMIREDVQAFEKELKEFLNNCKNVNVQIGDKEESRHSVKQLNELGDFSQQATENIESLRSEVRSLNLSLNESFSMTAEAKSLFAMFKNPEYTKIQDYANQNQTNRRLLLRLQTVLTNNEKQIDFIHKQLSAQWAEYEEVRKQYSKDRMHVPSLEGVYETLTRQRDIIFRQREKINYIKNKMGVKLLSVKAQEDKEATVDSIADSILSMTLFEKLNEEAEKIDPKKLKALASYLEKRPVVTIKPKRPDRKEIKSEVILEKKEQLAKANRLKESKPEVPKASITSITTTASVPQKPIQQQSFSIQPQPVIKPVSAAQPAVANPIKFPEIKAALAQPKPQAIIPQLVTSTEASNNAQPIKSVPRQLPAFGSTPAQQPIIPFGNPTKPISTGNMFGSLICTTPTIVPMPTKPVMSISTGTVNREQPTSNIAPIQAGGGDQKLNFDFSKSSSKTNIFETLAKSQVPEQTIIVPKPIIPPVKAVDPTPAEIKAPQKPIPISQPLSGNPLFGNLTTTSVPSTASSFSFSLSLPKTTAFASPTTTTTTAAPPVVVKTEDTTKAEFTFSLPSAKPKSTTETKAPVEQVTSSEPSKPADQEGLLNLKICSPTTKPTPTVDPTKNLFSMAAFGSSAPIEKPSSTASTTTPLFGAVSSTVVTSPIATSAQGAVVSSTSPDPKSIFGQAAATLPASTAPTGLFASVPVPATIKTEPNPVSSLPKPDQSVFGVPIQTPATQAAPAAGISLGTLSFGSVATTAGTSNPANVFGSVTSAPSEGGFGGSGGSIFGGNSSGGFGAAGTSPSIFGGGVKSPPENKNMFGGGLAQNSAPGTGIFGQAAANTGFGGQPTNVFGSPQPSAQQTSSGGSMFGGTSAFGSNTQTNSPSMFGATAATTNSFSFATASAAPSFGSPAATSNIFGAPAPNQSPFGAPATNNSFGQATSTPAFGQTSPFQKPAATFGSPAVFGAQPAFGAAPTFGGAPSFGSPTGAFGSTSPGFGAAAAQSTGAQNSLFASLGSSDSGLSFGNLAQTANSGQQNQQFGGSAFTAWRS